MVVVVVVVAAEVVVAEVVVVVVVVVVEVRQTDVHTCVAAPCGILFMNRLPAV